MFIITKSAGRNNTHDVTYTGPSNENEIIFRAFWSGANCMIEDKIVKRVSDRVLTRFKNFTRTCSLGK